MLERKIGEGAMGVVYRATHAMLRRPAAIKLLLKDRASEVDLARFEREAQITSRLVHPNTISIFDYGRTAEGVFYYVMEYLDGLDLAAPRRPIRARSTPARAINILAQVSGALAEAHALGLIHRDIKPANIVLTERPDEPDVVKVVDFGLVKTFGRSMTESASSHTITGTPLYMAPEAISQPDTVDGRADLYALGAVAYFLLTGQHVFQAASALEVCSKHMLEPPVPPSRRLGKPLPADLEAVVLACLAKDSRRPPGVGRVAAGGPAGVRGRRPPRPAGRSRLVEGETRLSRTRPPLGRRQCDRVRPPWPSIWAAGPWQRCPLREGSHRRRPGGCPLVAACPVRAAWPGVADGGQPGRGAGPGRQRGRGRGGPGHEFHQARTPTGERACACFAR